MDNDQELRQLREALFACGNPERAVHEKRYLKSDDAFLGVSVPAGQRIAKDFRRTHKSIPFSQVRDIARELWHGRYHEEKRLAVQLLDLYHTELAPEDWPLLLAWVREAGSWDLVDEIAAHLLGWLAERWHELDADLNNWINDKNLWVRRAALVSFVLRIRHATVPFDRIRTLCDSLLPDREYFVQKALGWVLRECAVQDTEGTVAFLSARVERIPRSTLREAVRKLDMDVQQHILGGKCHA